MLPSILPLLPLLSSTALLTVTLTGRLSLRPFLIPSSSSPSVPSSTTVTPTSKPPTTTNTVTTKLLPPPSRAPSPKIGVRTWFSHFALPLFLYAILPLSALSIVGGTLCAIRADGGSVSKRLFAAGVGFTVLHYAFASGVARAIQGAEGAEEAEAGAEVGQEEHERRGNGDGDGKRKGMKGATEALREYVRLYMIRTMVADLPAWACFVGAVVCDVKGR